LTAARSDAQQAHETQGVVSEGSLTRTHYLAPQFPESARAKNIEGWVDLQFVVGSDGSVGDVAVVGAQPVGIFEPAAMEAVRHWRYQPVMRDGQAVSQRTHLRLRFTVQQ
jgi:protein TonB